MATAAMGHKAVQLSFQERNMQGRSVSGDKQPPMVAAGRVDEFHHPLSPGGKGTVLSQSSDHRPNSGGRTVSLHGGPHIDGLLAQPNQSRFYAMHHPMRIAGPNGIVIHVQRLDHLGRSGVDAHGVIPAMSLNRSLENRAKCPGSLNLRNSVMLGMPSYSRIGS